MMRQKPCGLYEGFYNASRRHRDRPALVLEGGARVLTYAELAHQAAEVELALGHEVPSGSIVGVLGDHSLGAYAAVLGVLAHGCMFMPLGPALPPRRLVAMIRSSGCRHIVVGEDGLVRLEELISELREARASEIVTFLLPPRCEAKASPPPECAVLRSIPSRPLAVLPRPSDAGAGGYVMYTSGSTGSPKKIVVEDRHVCSYLTTVLGKLCYTPDDRCTQSFALSFDPAVHDMFATWWTGASLYPLDRDEVLDIEGFIRANEITVAAMVPSVAMACCSLNRGGDRPLRSLRLVLFCGEPLTVVLASAWERRAPRAHVVNLYGPTELTINITMYDWTRNGVVDQIYVPIGRVFSTHAYSIRDANNEPVASGEIGALHVAGPQSTVDGWYPTGDLVEERSGVLIYRGRIDRQVKIHGNRVNLLEVEIEVARALGAERVACVFDGELVAFVVGADVLDHRTACLEALPPAMIPSRFFSLSEMPRTTSGKVDYAGLAEIAAERTVRVRESGPSGGVRELLLEYLRDLGREVSGLDPEIHLLSSGLLSSFEFIGLAEFLARRLGVKIRLDGCSPRDFLRLGRFEEIVTRSWLGAVVNAPALVEVGRGVGEGPAFVAPESVRIDAADSAILVAECLSRVFTKSEPLTRALGAEVADFLPLALNFCRQAQSEGLLLAATCRVTGAVIGFAVAEPDGISDSESHGGVFGAVFALMDELPIRKHVEVGAGLLLLFLGVDELLLPPGVSSGQIARALMAELLKRAAAAGYDHVGGHATGIFSRAIYEEFGFTSVENVRYGDFTHRGRRPFAQIALHGACHLYLRSLSDTRAVDLSAE